MRCQNVDLQPDGIDQSGNSDTIWRDLVGGGWGGGGVSYPLPPLLPLLLSILYKALNSYKAEAHLSRETLSFTRKP